jgi:hypothetical protein
VDQDQGTQSLLAAHKALLDEYGTLFSRTQLIWQQIQTLEGLLAQRGYWAPIGDYTAASQSQVQEPPPPPPSPVQTLDEAIIKMVAEKGVPDTAISYIEWLFGTNQVAAPASVRKLLDAFPKLLRDHYNDDPVAATEALRGQIKSRVDIPGVTTLSYENGNVGLKAVAPAS